MTDRDTPLPDDELDRLLASLPYPAPSSEFADRVMARIALPQAVEVRQPTRLPARRPIAIAASLAVLVAGSVAASVIWSFSHLALVTSLGGGLADVAGQWILQSAQAVAQPVVTHPGLARAAAISPGTVVATSATGSALYAGGVFALRRLLATPNERVTNA